MITRLKYEKADDGYEWSNTIIIGIRSYSISILPENNDVLIFGSFTDYIQLGSYSTRAKAKKAAKEKLIEMGANFSAETRRKLKKKSKVRKL